MVKVHINNTSYNEFVCDRYRKARLVCVWLSDLPVVVSTSPAIMRSSAIHPAGPHGWLAQETVNRAAMAGSGFDTICTAVCHNCGDSSTTVVVVCLPRPMEGMERLQFSDLFAELPVPPQVAGVGGTF